MRTINDADLNKLLTMKVMLPKPPDIDFCKDILEKRKTGLPQTMQIAMIQQPWFVDAGQKVWEDRQELGLGKFLPDKLTAGTPFFANHILAALTKGRYVEMWE